MKKKLTEKAKWGLDYDAFMKRDRVVQAALEWHRGNGSLESLDTLKVACRALDKFIDQLKKNGLI